MKFNKKKVYYQFVFFFPLIKPALKNLDKLNDVVTVLLVRKKIKSDQHNAASPLYFFFKLIINNLKSFIPGTSNVVSQIVFCSNIAASKTSFWACPLKTDLRKLNACDVCSPEAHLKVFFLAAFLKKRMYIDADYTWKTTSLKVRQISVYALTVRLGFRFSAWSSRWITASKRQGRMKPVKVSTIHLIVLIRALILGWYQKISVHALVGFKPTAFVYLQVLLVYQRMQFSRLGIRNDADWIRICDKFGQ